MCLLDTVDGALMFSLYIQPAQNFLSQKAATEVLETSSDIDDDELPQSRDNHRDPVAFLYYSIVLTILTVIVAIVIGVIQLLTMILNVTDATGKFWDGVQTAGDYYDAIGGGICGCFIIFGGLSVVVYKPWRRWMDQRYGRSTVAGAERSQDEEPEAGEDGVVGSLAGEDDVYKRGQTTVITKGDSTRVTTTEGRRIEEETV
jgi:high-affinity nickel-transport protein